MTKTETRRGGSVLALTMALALTVVLFTSLCCCCGGGPLSDEERSRLNEQYAQRQAEEQAKRAALEAEKQAEWEALPASQRTFCEALMAYNEVYSTAGNDLKRSKARRDRSAALRAAVPGGKVSKWVGTVSTLTTTGDGNVVLRVDLPCKGYSMGTWNNELSDIGDRTLIPASSSAYETLANMEVGSGLTFSGRLIADEVNGWKGTSLTERGSMMGELFLIRFE